MDSLAVIFLVQIKTRKLNRMENEKSIIRAIFSVISHQKEIDLSSVLHWRLLMFAKDLAGYCYYHPNYWQTQARINTLINRFLSSEILTAAVVDLPTQFANPHVRPWQKIAIDAIQPEQIIGMDSEQFYRMLRMFADIEEPIRGYSKESRDYTLKAHPQFARFIGGIYDEHDRITEVGVWEKEERRHGPLYKRLYCQLTQNKFESQPHSVLNHPIQGDSLDRIGTHLMSRITTEWSACAGYIWLMAHCTGELQNAIAQILQDEVNHLAKFWGFTRWELQYSFFQCIRHGTIELIKLFLFHRNERSETREGSSPEHWQEIIETIFAFNRVIVQLYRWNKNLKPEFLNEIFGDRQMPRNLAL
jgi:hypothetical protein